MHNPAGSLSNAVDKLTVPAVAWLTHILHIALPDLVLLATLVYTVLQVAVILRGWTKKKTTKENDDGR